MQLGHGLAETRQGSEKTGRVKGRDVGYAHCLYATQMTLLV